MNLGIAWLCPFIAERFSDFNVSVFIKQMDIQDMDSVKVGFTEQSANAKIIHRAQHAATKVCIWFIENQTKIFYRSSIFRIEFASVLKLFSFGELTIRI